MLSDNDNISNWDELNPANFEYHETYYDENGISQAQKENVLYTPNDPKSQEDINNVYFVNAYSTKRLK